MMVANVICKRIQGLSTERDSVGMCLPDASSCSHTIPQEALPMLPFANARGQTITPRGVREIYSPIGFWDVLTIRTTDSMRLDIGAVKAHHFSHIGCGIIQVLLYAHMHSWYCSAN